MNWCPSEFMDCARLGSATAPNLHITEDNTQLATI
jgi:hypothetical protein